MQRSEQTRGGRVSCLMCDVVLTGSSSGEKGEDEKPSADIKHPDDILIRAVERDVKWNYSIITEKTADPSSREENS